MSVGAKYYLNIYNKIYATILFYKYSILFILQIKTNI